MKDDKILIEALDKIAYPVKHLQIQAKKEEMQLDGQAAIQLAKDANWLSAIAKQALADYHAQPSQSLDAMYHEYLIKDTCSTPMDFGQWIKYFGKKLLDSIGYRYSNVTQSEIEIATKIYENYHAQQPLAISDVKELAEVGAGKDK